VLSGGQRDAERGDGVVTRKTGAAIVWTFRGALLSPRLLLCQVDVAVGVSQAMVVPAGEMMGGRPGVSLAGEAVA
jgi:hypothetical protein